MEHEEKEYLYKSIGEKVKYFRMKSKFSQEDLGKKVGKSRTSIVNIEKGMQHPPIHLLIDISRKLNVPLDAVLEINKLNEYNSNKERRLEEVLQKIDIEDKEVITNFINSKIKKD